MTSFTTASCRHAAKRKMRGAPGAVAGANSTLPPPDAVNTPRVPSRRAVQIDLRTVLADRARRDPDAARARADGGRQRAGVPPPGTPLRRRARLLGDGLAAPGSSTATSARSATCASPRTSIRWRSRSSAPSPRAMAEAARHGRGRRRRPRRHQLRLPGAEGDEDRRRRDAARGSRSRLPRSSSAVAAAVDVPVSVKMRRGLRDGSRACLDVGPRLVDGGRGVADPAPALGAADVHGHRRPRADGGARRRSSTCPSIASGDITSRARAQAVLATTGAAAVMVGRGAQGNPWALREIVDGDAARADARGGRRRARPLRPRDRARAGRAARARLPEEVLRLVPRAAAASRGRSSRSSSSSTSTEEVERRLIAAAPGRAAADRAARGRAAGRRRGPARAADLDLRRRLSAERAAARQLARRALPCERAVRPTPRPTKTCPRPSAARRGRSGCAAAAPRRSRRERLQSVAAQRDRHEQARRARASCSRRAPRRPRRTAAGRRGRRAPSSG